MLEIIKGKNANRGFIINENPKATQKEAHTGHKRISLITGILTRNLLIGENTLEWLQSCDNDIVIKKNISKAIIYANYSIIFN